MSIETKRFKERLVFALSISGKGQNEIARETGASKSVASEWFSSDSDVLPGGKYLTRLPRALHVNGHWLITGEGHWFPAPASTRKDTLLAEGVEIGTRNAVAEMRNTISRIEKQLAKSASSPETAQVQAAFADAEADVGAPTVPTQRARRGGRR